MNKFLILFTLISFCYLKAEAQSIEPKFSYNVELTLPVAMGNKPFNDIMQGLVNVSTYGQYSFPFHLNVGAGVKYAYLTINEFSVPSPRYGGVHTGAAFVKVGYDKFHSERFATDYGIKVGYSQNYFYSYLDKEKETTTIQINAPIVEGTVAFILSADERNSYRWVIGYGVQGYGFRPQNIGLQSNEGYDVANFNKLTNYLIVGFGYTYYFRQGKSGE